MVYKELRSIKTKYSNKIEMNLNTLLATEKKKFKKINERTSTDRFSIPNPQLKKNKNTKLYYRVTRYYMNHCK